MDLTGRLRFCEPRTRWRFTVFRSAVTASARLGNQSLRGVDRHDFILSQSLNVSQRGLSEETAVLPVELAHALISNLVGCGSCIESVHEHALPCRLQAKLLLVLKWAHRGQRAELMMKGRHGHPSGIGEFFNVQRLRVVVSQPGNRSCCLVAHVARRCDCAETFSLRGKEDSVHNLAVDQAAQEWNIARRIQ